MKPLDFVKTPLGGIAIVSETNDSGYEVAISFIYNPAGETKVAWWDESELEVVHNLPNLLASMTRHPFGCGQDDVNSAFPREEKKP